MTLLSVQHLSGRILPALLALLTILSVTGCSLLPAKGDISESTTNTVPTTVTTATAPETETEEQQSENIHYRPIPAATLYSLLVAEMAGQRQRFDISLYNYMNQARTTRDPAIAERAAQIAQFVGSNSHALEAVNIWLEENPNNPAAHQAASQLLMEQGKFSEALQHLEILQDLTGISQFDYLAANASHLPPEQQQKLANELAGLISKYPDDATLWYARGIMAQHLQQYPEALHLIEKALSINPSYLSASLQKARILVLLDRSDDAINWLDELLEDNPDNKGIQVLQARIYLEQHDMERALAAFTGLYQDFPDDSAILLSLALLERELGQTDRATEHFFQLLTRRSQTNEAHFYLGQIAEENQQPQTAIEQYSQVTGGREFLPAHLRASELISSLSGIDDARDYLDTLRASYPRRSSELVRIETELLTSAGLNEDAITLVSTALTVMPDDIDLLYTRAMLAERVDDIAMLEHDLRSVIHLNPDHSEALNALGYTLADRTDRWSEALPLIKRALQLSPDNPAVIDSLGWIYFRMGDFDQARPLLEKAYGMMNDHEIAAHYGELLWLTGEQDKALMIWATGLTQTPDSPIIEHTLQRLNISADQLPAINDQ